MKESPIFVKSFDFLKWLLGRTEKFPKSQRFFLAKRLNDAMFDLYEQLGEAGLRKGARAVECLRLTRSDAPASEPAENVERMMSYVHF